MRPMVHPRGDTGRLLLALLIWALGMALFGGLLPAGRIAAQGGGPPATGGFFDEGLAPAPQPEAAPAAPAPAGALPAANARIYLPLLRGSPAYSAQFAAQISASQEPIAPADSFRRGITRVYAVLQIRDAAGQRWRTEWYRDGLRIPGLVASGTIQTGNNDARMVRRLSYAGGGPLPTGAYTIRLYLDGQKVLEEGFSIR